MHSQEGVSQPAVVTIGFRYLGDDFEADHINVTNGWTVRMMPFLGSPITFLGAKYSTNLGTVAETTRAVPGGVSVPTAPYSVAYLIHKHNFTVGRRGNGRMFLPGVNEGAVNAAGFIAPAEYTPLQAGMDALYEGFVTDNFQPVLFHGPGAGSATPPSSFVTSFGVDQRVATQRNRLRR